MKFTKSICLIVLLSAMAAHATTRYVSPSGTAPFQSIQAAISASANGDTVLVGPGIYAQDISVSNRLTIIGAGWDQTRLNGSFQLNAAANAGTVIEGFRVVGVNTWCLLLNSGCDSVTVRRCRLENSTYITAYLAGSRLLLEDCVLICTVNGTDLALVSSNRVVFRNCLFYHSFGSNTNCQAIDGVNGNLEIYNCVFLNFNVLLNCTGVQPVVFINNVVYDWGGASPSYGTYLVGSMFDYNASNQITPPGTHAVLLAGDPFVSYDESLNYDESTSNLHPAPGSPLINAGHPDITDLDATISDLGIYGGPRPVVNQGVPSYPFALTLTTVPTLIGIGDTVQVNSSGRVGPRY